MRARIEFRPGNTIYGSILAIVERHRADLTPDTFVIDGVLSRNDGADWTAKDGEEATDALLGFIDSRGWGFGGTMGVLL